MLFYIFATASANLITTAIPNLTVAHGTEKTRQGLQQTVQGFQPGGGLGETLFGSLQAGLRTFGGLIEAIFALPILLENLGIPSPITAFLMAPLGFVVLYDGIHIMTGRLSR
jgi:hypothetical protein